MTSRHHFPSVQFSQSWCHTHTLSPFDNQHTSYQLANPSSTKMPIRATRLTSLLRTGPSLVRPASSIATRTATAATSASSAGAARPRPSRHSIQLQPLQPARPGDGRAFASGGATIGKAQSDLLVDELQELYVASTSTSRTYPSPSPPPNQPREKPK